MLNTKQPTQIEHVALGKYILDSISIGMYDNPLMAIREYIQNSVDAIDALEDGSSRRRASIDITVDGRSRSLKIKDNGTGISCHKARTVLHDLGNSEKDPKTARGFRGMGRLAGLAYCRELKFIAKSKGEKIVSVSTWDCRKLLDLIGDKENLIDAASAVEAVATFEHNTCLGNIEDHYCIVEMNGIQSPMNVLLNVPVVKTYVSQMAPVPFDPTQFSFGRRIEDELRKNVPLYGTYRISVNGQRILKPYTDTIRARGGAEKVAGVRFFPLSVDSGALALGWLGEWSMSGTIDPATLLDGLRVRCGNMLIGDKNILSGFFREKRFNNYLMGEIHIIDGRLIPNSRRDDLEDNSLRDDLRSCFVREIGIPYSRKIRELSNDRSARKLVEDCRRLQGTAKRIVERGYLAEMQKEQVTRPLQELLENTEDIGERSRIGDLLSKVMRARHALDMLDGEAGSILGCDLNPYKRLFEVMYREMADKDEAEAILNKALIDLFRH